MSIIKLQIEMALKNNNIAELKRLYKIMMEENSTRVEGSLGYAKVLMQDYETILDAKEILAKIRCNTNKQRQLVYLEEAKVELYLGNYEVSQKKINNIPKELSHLYIRSLIKVNSALKKQNFKCNLNPKFAKEILLDLGDYNVSIGNYEQAIKKYEEYIKEKPNEFMGYKKLMTVYYKLGDLKSAKNILQNMKFVYEKSDYIEKLLNETLDKDIYYMLQKKDYTDERLISHVEKHMEYYGDKSYIYQNMNISKNLPFIKDNLNKKNFYRTNFVDHYVIKFPKNIGENSFIKTNKLEVITHVNSKKILTMYPHISQFPLNYKEEKNYIYLKNRKPFLGK